MAGELWFMLYAALAAALVGALAMVGVWLHTRAKTSRAFLVMEQLWAVAQSVVAHVDAKVRPTLKSALADGKLTPEERKLLQDEALKAFKDALGQHGTEKIRKALGVAGGGMEAFLSGMLERAFRANHLEPALPAPVKVKTLSPAPPVPPLARP